MTLNFLIGLFYNVGLMDNVEEYRTMTSQPGPNITGISEEDFNRRSTGDGATYLERLR